MSNQSILSKDVSVDGTSVDDLQRDRIRFFKGAAMSDVVYVSKSEIERRKGPVRIAQLSGESQPVSGELIRRQ
jgi:hypothetical protein